MYTNDALWGKLLAKNSFDFKTLYNYMNKKSNEDANSKLEFLLASYLYLNDDKKGFDKLTKSNKSKFYGLLKKFVNYNEKDLEKITSANSLDEYLLNEISKCNNSDVLSDFFYQITKNGEVPDHFKNVFTKISYYLITGCGCDVTNFADSILNTYKRIIDDTGAYEDINFEFGKIENFVVRNVNQKNEKEENVINLLKNIRLAVSGVISGKGYNNDKIDSDDKKNELNKVIEKFINIYKYVYAGGNEVPAIGNLDIEVNNTNNVAENNAIISGVIYNFMKAINEIYLESDFEKKSEEIENVYSLFKEIVLIKNEEESKTLSTRINTKHLVSKFCDELRGGSTKQDLEVIYSKYADLLNYSKRIRTLENECNLNIYRQQGAPLYFQNIELFLNSQKVDCNSFKSYLDGIKEKVDINEFFKYRNNSVLSSLSYDSDRLELTRKSYKSLDSYKRQDGNQNPVDIGEFFAKESSILVFEGGRPATDFFALINCIVNPCAADENNERHEQCSEKVEALVDFLKYYLDELFEKGINENEKKALVLPLLAILHEANENIDNVVSVRKFLLEGEFNFINRYADKIINVFEKEFKAGKFEKIESLQKLYADYIDKKQKITDDKKTLDKDETEATKESDELILKEEVKEQTQNEEIHDVVADEKTEELKSTDEAITDDKLVKEESKDSDEKIDLSQKTKGISFKSLSIVEFKLETEPEVIQPLLIDEKVIDKTIELQEHDNVLLPSSYHDGSNKENLATEKIMPERTSGKEQFRKKIKYFEGLSKDNKEMSFTRSVTRRRTEKSAENEKSR